MGIKLFSLILIKNKKLMRIVITLIIIIMATLTNNEVSAQTILHKKSASVEVVEIYQADGPFDNSVMLEWKTVSENKNEGFVIERKKSEIEDFEFAGFIDGNGTTKYLNKYTFIERRPSKNVTYRIKQISYNGEISYFYPAEVVASFD